MSRGAGLIVLLSDFGTRDWYVPVLKGVILSRAPAVRLVDLTHEIPPQDILAGAFTLAATAPWFPKGAVFLCVVDPSVGSRRVLLAARADGQFFVGPDNGLLGLTLERATQATIVQLTQRRFWLTPISRTFHGRDILAPVAAHLATGGRLAALGRSVRQTAPLLLPRVQQRDRTVTGEIVHIDAFGNLITNLDAARWLSRRGSLRFHRRHVPWVSSYSEGEPEQLIALVNALGLVELAIREGSAAWSVNAKRGDKVELLL